MITNRFTTQVVFVCLALVTVMALAQAQSGRRQPRAPSAAPVPTPTPEPSPTPKKEKEDSDLGFIVGVDESSTFSSFPLSYYDAVVSGCSERLRDGSSAHVSVSGGRGLNRSEAIKRAKAETKTYVVVLTLTGQAMGVQSSTGSQDAELEYVVFAPVTGKIATSGRTYQNANRQGPVVVGPTSPRGTSGLYREALLKRAGEDAGDRILKSLHLNAPVINR
jgi:hypothetical protein